MRTKALIPLIMMMCVSVTGCSDRPPEPKSSDPQADTPIPTSTAAPTMTPTPEHIDITGITARTYPRVDGSTSTHPLQLTIACHLLEVKCAWIEYDFFGSTRQFLPEASLVTSDEVEAILNIYHSGTHGSYINLIEKNADLILVAREPSEDEFQAATEKRVVLDVQPVALDAFVFMVHVDNPVTSLRLEQIRDIYSGKIRNWSEVGGDDAEIHTYQRDPNSGSQELMEKLVMRGTAMLDSPDLILETMMGPFNAIQDDPLGIGYSVYYYAATIYPAEGVRMLAIEGIAPESETIAAGTYGLVTEVYVVLREDTPPGRHARTLRDWLLTTDGQRTVAASGYVSLSR